MDGIRAVMAEALRVIRIVLNTSKTGDARLPSLRIERCHPIVPRSHPQRAGRIAIEFDDLVARQAFRVILAVLKVSEPTGLRIEQVQAIQRGQPHLVLAFRQNGKDAIVDQRIALVRVMAIMRKAAGFAIQPVQTIECADPNGPARVFVNRADRVVAQARGVVGVVTIML